MPAHCRRSGARVIDRHECGDDPRCLGDGRRCKPEEVGVAQSGNGSECAVPAVARPTVAADGRPEARSGVLAMRDGCREVRAARHVESRELAALVLVGEHSAVGAAPARHLLVAADESPRRTRSGCSSRYSWIARDRDADPRSRFLTGFRRRAGSQTEASVDVGRNPALPSAVPRATRTAAAALSHFPSGSSSIQMRKWLTGCDDGCWTNIQPTLAVWMAVLCRYG